MSIKKGIGKTSIESMFLDSLKRKVSVDRRENIYPSDCFCPRKNFLMSKREQTVFRPPESSIFMNYGNMIESLISEGLETKGTPFVNNYAIKPDETWNISGKIDFIIMENGEPVLIELKTCYPIPKKPRAEHTNQALVYSAYTGITNVHLVYAKRLTKSGTFDIKSFDISPKQKKLHGVVTNIFFSQRMIKEDILPSIPGNFSEDKECRFCHFKSFCWGDEKLKEFDSVSDETKRDILEYESARAREYVSKENLKNRRNKTLADLESIFNGA